MTDAQATEALRREALCLQAKAIMDPGASLNEAARRLGVPVASLHRYLRQYSNAGFSGIVPKQDKSGRESLREHFVAQIGEEAMARVEKRVAGLALDLSPAVAGGARRLSDGLAWRTLARQPDCPEPIRAYFAAGRRRSKHSIAPSIRAATRPGPLLDARHHGPRAFGLAGPYQPRALDILPGDIFSSDDTTPIWAWWVPWPRSERYPHGVKLLQGQFLPVIDVASQDILNYALIAREQSSYRAADIWRLMGRTHSVIGLPRLGWQKERGAWEANIIDGVVDESTPPTSAGPGHAQRVGGLRMLPSNLVRHHYDILGAERAAAWRTLRTFTSYLPKSKSVEGVFHRLQKFEGTLWGCLGRSQQRRPYERARKIFEACRAGRADPRLHFLSGTELMHRLNACIEGYRAEAIEGEVFRGVPPAVWESGIQEHGPLLTAPPERAWLLCSDWALVTVRHGMARIRRVDEATGLPVSYFYAHPSFCGTLDGRKALVYFNRDAFEEPAHVLIPGAGGNHQYIGQAAHVERRGMFLSGVDPSTGDLDGYALRKRQAGIVTTLYSDLAAHIPSRQLPAEIASRRTAVAIETRMPGGDFASRRSTRPPFDEAAELARIAALEAAARAEAL